MGLKQEMPKKLDFDDAFTYSDCKRDKKQFKDNNPNELKQVSFYKFHNTPIQKENIATRKMASDFRKAIRERSRNTWINLEVNRMIRHQHKNLKSWVREDKNVRFYIDTPEHGGGPRWEDVRIRQTFDARTGYMIEYRVIHPYEDHTMKRLPMGVTNIKTIFRYESKEDKDKDNHSNNSSQKKKKKRNKKVKKKNMRNIIKKDCKNNIPMMD